MSDIQNSIRNDHLCFHTSHKKIGYCIDDAARIKDLQISVGYSTGYVLRLLKPMGSIPDG